MHSNQITKTLKQYACIGICSPPALGDEYIEEWQQRQIKDPSFYETESQKRNYFYTVDLQGRLFLEESSPKNIATSLKSPKFLKFFFKQVRRNETGLHENYSMTSPCGKEMNFIKAGQRRRHTSVAIPNSNYMYYFFRLQTPRLSLQT